MKPPNERWSHDRRMQLLGDGVRSWTQVAPIGDGGEHIAFGYVVLGCQRRLSSKFALLVSCLCVFFTDRDLVCGINSLLARAPVWSHHPGRHEHHPRPAWGMRYIRGHGSGYSGIAPVRIETKDSTAMISVSPIHRWVIHLPW